MDDGDILFRLFGVTDIDWVAFVFIVKSFAVAVSEVPRFVTKLVLKNAMKWFSIIIFLQEKSIKSQLKVHQLRNAHKMYTSTYQITYILVDKLKIVLMFFNFRFDPSKCSEFPILKPCTMNVH